MDTQWKALLAQLTPVALCIQPQARLSLGSVVLMLSVLPVKCREHT